MVRGEAASAKQSSDDADLAVSPNGATPAARIEALGGDPNFMTSLARGLAVIQAFSQSKRHLTISQLSVATGLSRAAVRRISCPGCCWRRAR